MKTFRTIIFAALGLASLYSPISARADGTNPPPRIIVDRDDRDLLRDLRGVPDPIRELILAFDRTRDKYLAEQRALLIKLKNATTPEEREKIREMLQANRQQFLDELKAFREQLKQDLQNLKDKTQLGRIIDAAHDAATEGGLRHHKGK